MDDNRNQSVRNTRDIIVSHTMKKTGKSAGNGIWRSVMGLVVEIPLMIAVVANCCTTAYLLWVLFHPQLAAV